MSGAPSIDGLMKPTYSNLFVQQDATSNVLAIVAGDAIIAPERHADRVNAGRCKTGVVMNAGWDALREWPTIVGTRICWPPYVGSEFSLGAEKRIHLNSAEIICWFSETGREGRLDETWCEFAQAKPGQLLVERKEPPQYRGMIQVPAGHRTSYRQSEAVIISAGAGVDKATFFPGRRIFLPAESRAAIDFEGRVFYQINPWQVVALIDDQFNNPIDKGTEDPHAMMHGIDQRPPEWFDEGDTRGPR